MADSRTIIAMYRQGMTAPEVARDCGCGETTVYRILANAGIKRRTSGKTVYSADFLKQVADEYAAGDSLETLADRHGCSTWVIRRAIARNGGTARPIGQPFREFPEDTVTAIVSLYESGKSQADVAAAFGIGQTIVSRLLKDKGIDTGAIARREHHPAWRGGRYTTPEGYVLVISDEFPSMRRSNGYIPEHRLVMARSLGRPLERHESVHHRNGERSDNRLENLELFVGRHLPGATFAHCATCTCFAHRDSNG